MIGRSKSADLKPLADFLKTHGIVFDEDKGVWSIYGRYFYESLKRLIFAEGLGALMEVVYKIPWTMVRELECSKNLFHELQLVKNTD